LYHLVELENDWFSIRSILYLLVKGAFSTSLELGLGKVEAQYDILPLKIVGFILYAPAIFLICQTLSEIFEPCS